ncbi:MAG: arginine--tRNA ligase, partial [Pseudomonadota bacterium]|nr:arginine--tRNA ligase [Pseudomonadota bacterium]
MNLFADFEARVAALLAERVAAGALPEGLDLARFVVEPPREAAHGDLAVNAAMVYAKEAKAAGSNPRALAESLAEGLRQGGDVAGVEVAGPGFLNIRLKPVVFESVLRDVLLRGDAYGRGAARADGPVNVEYVSANPTGPMHVGHARGAVFGDALANLLAFSGAEVTREYYINDAGAQVDVLARSAFMRYREALGETITIPEGLYPGDYLKPVGEALAKAHGKALLEKPESEWLPIVKNAAIDAMMDMIRGDLAALNIRHEVFFSERTLHDRSAGPSLIDRAIDWLREKSLVYEGRLPPPKGA